MQIIGTYIRDYVTFPFRQTTAASYRDIDYVDECVLYKKNN